MDASKSAMAQERDQSQGSQQQQQQQQRQQAWLHSAAPNQMYSSQAGPSSEASSSRSSTLGLPSRYSHLPNVASPLRSAMQQPGSDESTPTGSPIASSHDALQNDRFSMHPFGARPLDGMQRAKSNVEHSSRENSPMGSGNTTPTSYPSDYHHHRQQHQQQHQPSSFLSSGPSSSSSIIGQRRHSDTTDHLAVHMTDDSSSSPSSSQWAGAETTTPVQRGQSRLSQFSTQEDTDLRRGVEVAGSGLLSSHYGPVSSAISSAVGGYASSVDTDFYSSAPPSRLVSRTPTPVLNGNQAAMPGSIAGGGGGLLTASGAVTNGGGINTLLNRSASPDYTNSTATDSDGEESDYPSGPGWGGARQMANLFGLGGGTRSGYKKLNGKSYHPMETRKSGSRKWNDHADSPAVESQRKLRGKEMAKSFDMSDGLGRPMGLADQRSSRLHRRRKQPSSPSRLPWPFRVFSSLLFKTFRTFFGPIHPLTIMIALALIAGFVTSVTMLIIYILNPDKEPLPWRTYCQQQMPFPHAWADALAPVNVLVGVITTDSKYERRNIIRQTYARHTLPLDAEGNQGTNVQVKFVLGKVRKSHMRRVALEMEAFNDIVVLDMEETQSARKTHGFLKWAAENATVPFLRPVEANWSSIDTVVPSASLPGGLSDWHLESDPNEKTKQRYQLGWKKVDYVVKADDDSFIVLDELERHLRVAPRKMTYWGYLIKNWFMGGEAYALSFDLVEWMAGSSEVARSAKGKEDTRTPQWIALHPNRSSINWVSEHCWIYDHPKGASPYSHGFLFPDYVEKIKVEARYGLSEQEIAYRGGERASQAYSTVTKWHQPYSAPRSDLTAEEEVEALVEGGGRWAGTWVKSSDGKAGESWIPYEDIVYGSNDARLRPSVANEKGSSVLAEDVGWEHSSGLYIYGSVASTQTMNSSSSSSHSSRKAARDGAVHVRNEEGNKRDLLEDLAGLPGHLLNNDEEKAPPFSPLVSAAPLSSGGKPTKNDGSAMHGKYDYRYYRPHLLPRPTHKDGNGEYAALRAQRYLNRPHGGTVVVHYLKKTEWWLETALALSGKPKLWTNGAGGRGKEWRMGGSPLTRSDGYILEGRSQPHPVGLVAPNQGSGSDSIGSGGSGGSSSSSTSGSSSTLSTSSGGSTSSHSSSGAGIVEGIEDMNKKAEAGIRRKYHQ